MFFVTYVLLLTFLASKASAGYSQYFYSSPVRTSYFPQTYQPIIHQQPLAYQQYQQPLFPSPYVAVPTPLPQPTQYIHTGLNGFNYQPQALVNVQPVQDYRIPNVQRRVSPLPQPQEEIQNYETTPVQDNFRGFAYQTQYEQGGRSAVVFITGPEVNKFRSSVNINTRTSASDAVDSNFNKEEASQTSEQNESIEALVSFLQNPQPGIRKFYSVNNALVARNSEEEISGFPASSAPLKEPISPIFPILRSSFNFGAKNTEPSQKKEDPLPSASEPQARTSIPEKSTTEATSTTTTVASSSTSTTTVGTTSKTTMAPIIVEDDKDSTEEIATTQKSA